MNGGTVMRGHPTVAGQLELLSGGGGPNPTPNSNQKVTDWYIDPAGTNGGKDTNNGRTAQTPLKTVAKWRQLIWGARYGSTGYPTIVTIHALSGSTNDDDGIFYGFITTGPTARVVVIGTPTTVGVTSTLTGATAGYVGNARATITDSSLPVSWTASYGITNTARSRFVRRVGGAGPCIAPLIQDQGSKTAMIGLATTTSDTSNAAPVATITNFTVGDTYQVYARPTWPQLLNINCSVRLQCFDIYPALFGSYWVEQAEYSLCGFTTNGVTTFHLPPPGTTDYVNCVFAACPSFSFGNVVPRACSFMAGLQVAGVYAWDGTTSNVFLGSGALGSCIKLIAGANLSSGLGVLRFFDDGDFLVLGVDGSQMALGAASIVGSNNTGGFISLSNAANFYGAGQISATTSKALPYTTNGVNYAGPTVDNNAGYGSRA